MSLAQTTHKTVCKHTVKDYDNTRPYRTHDGVNACKTAATIMYTPPPPSPPVPTKLSWPLAQLQESKEGEVFGLKW